MFLRKLKNSFKNQQSKFHNRNFSLLYKQSNGDPWNTTVWDKRLTATYSLISEINLNNKEVLDVGCGYGYFIKMVLEKYPKAKISGIDIASQPIDKLKKEIKADLRVSDISEIPFKDNQFDLILCMEILYYLKSKDKAIYEVNRVLKKGGWLLLGLTFGFGYIQKENEILGKLGPNFKIIKRAIFSPKPFPIRSEFIGELMLKLSFMLPFKFNIKIYYLLQKE